VCVCCVYDRKKWTEKESSHELIIQKYILHFVIDTVRRDIKSSAIVH
jgi:hypothetical protein